MPKHGDAFIKTSNTIKMPKRAGLLHASAGTHCHRSSSGARQRNLMRYGLAPGGGIMTFILVSYVRPSHIFAVVVVVVVVIAK